MIERVIGLEKGERTQYELEKRVEELSKKLEKLEAKSTQRSIFGPDIWVLIPVAAIVMWGLSNIFS
ncbi:hypothetical protein M4D55_03245 [Metabacillus idriensis]|uniref:Uncharacterized protein n=1 Tax=Metabacillus idriensis TaxID=324768 RepID=A0A6I2MBN3_9BACI|nr:hypothetical protein [Metabacillus idriensis]MCM3594805.1 hypothetical protein [Metabacillus idriensis]MRX53173.1 hypothetical protein [Metabacillus idriensis]OHR66214.1 hypothetical protein HMPREF3291_12110 [Bacillus sp. HMSC76G11]